MFEKVKKDLPDEREFCNQTAEVKPTGHMLGTAYCWVCQSEVQLFAQSHSQTQLFYAVSYTDIISPSHPNSV